VESVKFNVDDIISGQSTDIKDEAAARGAKIMYNGREIKVWDHAKYGKIIDRFSKNYINYVIVMFNHPDNPPSNSTQYIYLEDT